MLEVEMAKEQLEAKCNYDMLNGIIDSYGQSIQQLVFTYVKDYAMAEDLTQEIFIKVYNKLHTFKQESSLKTWLYRVAINHCKDYLKSWHHRNLILDNQFIDQAEANGKDLDQKLIQASEEQRLVTAVLRLALKYREVVYLYYYEELSTKEISLLTHENENTIKTRLKRAKEMIRTELEKEG